MPLRELLTEACMTQRGMAEASGLDIATVERLVNGHSLPRIPTARAICEVLTEVLRRPVGIEEVFPPYTPVDGESHD